MKTRRQAIAALAVLVAVACFVGTACSTGPQRPETLVIGMLAPLTGNGARFGQSQRDAVQLAIDELNAKGGVGGRRLSLLVEDTKTEPPTAVTAFTRLADRGDILALFGSAASLDVPAYLPQVDRVAIPHLVPVAVLPKITEMGSKWTFRSALNDAIAARKMAEFVVTDLKASKIALLLENSAFGETGLIFAERAEQLGVKPLVTERFKRGDLDVKPQLTKLQTLGVTHIQFWGYYSEYALVAKQLRELGYKATLMGNQAPVNDKTLELAGDALEGALNICLFVPTADTPEVRDFDDRYRQRYGSLPDTWAAQSYDAMRILAQVIEKSGPSRQAIRDGLAAVKDYRGLTGTVSFMANGDAAFRDTSIVQVVGGRFVPYNRGTHGSATQ